jgi:hypothetical protein
VRRLAAFGSGSGGKYLLESSGPRGPSRSGSGCKPGEAPDPRGSIYRIQWPGALLCPGCSAGIGCPARMRAY